MSLQQQSSSSFLSNLEILELDEIFTNLLPVELQDSLLADDNLEEGNQSPTDISTAAKPQGIDEATSELNTKQVIEIEPTDLGESDTDSERKATEEEEKTVNANEKARIDGNVLPERVEEIEKTFHKNKLHPGCLEVRLKNKPCGDSKIFYIYYVQDGKILNARKIINQAKVYMVRSPGAKCRYLKCVCLICRESGQEIIGRSNFLLEHLRKIQKIKIQCVYCGRLFQSHQRAVDHIREYHWKFGENTVEDKENLKK